MEIVTHATPTRRLWMGPQFSFKTYSIPVCRRGRGGGGVVKGGGGGGGRKEEEKEEEGRREEGGGETNSRRKSSRRRKRWRGGSKWRNEGKNFNNNVNFLVSSVGYRCNRFDWSDWFGHWEWCRSASHRGPHFPES